MLTRPILVLVPAFDATQQQTFTFTVIGGDQVVANRLVIRDQDTNTPVYDEKQETFRYEHIVNAGELTNGTYYTATLTTFDSADNESTASVPIPFWCYTTPTIEFSNMPTGNIIQNSTFEFQFTYNQAEGERLNSYVVNLYNSAHLLISSSNTMYADDGTPPYTGSYTFTGFENATDYYIEVVGTTIENTVVTTGQIEINVRYLRPDLFTLIELQNNCKGGYISIRSNIVLIDGESNPDPPTYINGEEIDLRGEDAWVQWNQGYNITGDMLTRIWFRDPNPYTEIMRFSNTSGQIITMNFMQGYENVNSTDMQAYLEIYVQSAQGFNYYIYSNFIDILPDDQYYNAWLRRVNDIYELILTAVPTTTTTT